MEESVIRNFWPGKTAGTQFSSVYASILLPIFTLNLSFPLCKIVMIQHTAEEATPMCF